MRSEESLYVRAAGSRRFESRRGLPESTNTYPTLALDPRDKLLVSHLSRPGRQTDAGWEMIDAQQGLTTNDISAVMQDREGSIWLGCSDRVWRAGWDTTSGRAGANAKG